jgi:hypothetical protein
VGVRVVPQAGVEVAVVQVESFGSWHGILLAREQSELWEETEGTGLISPLEPEVVVGEV